MRLIAGILWLGVVLHLFPVAWMISASLKPTHEIFEQPFNLVPRQPTTASYKLLSTTVTASGMNLNVDVFRYPLRVYLQNSLLIAFLTYCSRCRSRPWRPTPSPNFTRPALPAGSSTSSSGRS